MVAFFHEINFGLDKTKHSSIYLSFKTIFRPINKRYENKSVIIITNINFNNWDEVFIVEM